MDVFQFHSMEMKPVSEGACKKLKRFSYRVARQELIKVKLTGAELSVPRVLFTLHLAPVAPWVSMAMSPRLPAPCLQFCFYCHRYAAP